MGKSEAVMGIETDKLDVSSINDALDKLEIQPDGKATLEARVRALQVYFEKVDEEKSAPTFECTNCEQVSTFPNAVCPFCGVGDDAEPAALPGPDDDGPGDPDEADTRHGPESPEQPEETSTDGLAAEVAEQVLVPAKRKGRKAKAQLALVPPVEKVHEGIVETALDKAVEELKKLSTIASTGGWYLARKLAEIDISGLWKTRVTTEGKAVHKNFDAFVKAELGFSREYYQGLLRIVARFTEEEYKQLGPTKLRLVVAANDPEEEARRLKRFQDGVSRREVEREIGRKPDNAKSEKPKPSTAGKLTIAFVEGKREKVPFFLKPASKKDEGDGGKPAKRVGDTPYARVQMTNDVWLYVTLTQNKAGEIVGVFEYKRVDPLK